MTKKAVALRNSCMETRGTCRSLLLSALVLSSSRPSAESSISIASAFQPSYYVSPTITLGGRSKSYILTRRSRLFSSIGDDDEPPPNDPNKNEGELGDFLDPKKESDSLQKAREYMSETSLPISFEQTEGSSDDGETSDNNDGLDDLQVEDGPESSALVGPASTSPLFAGEAATAAQLAKNPYMQVVSKLSPSELISKFTASANPKVQEAVRSTVLGLIGSLPKMAFDTTTITTGQRLASLMFQLQMTGYMFKNAEYRLSLSQSLGMTNGQISSNLLLSGAADDEATLQDAILSGKVRGKLKIHLGGGEATKDPSATEEDMAASGTEIEVDAAAYMSELRTEVDRLKEELNEHKEAKDEEVRKDLLLYIRTLPARELKALTNTLSQDVLVCMKGLVQAVLAGVGDGKIAPDTVTEQSGEAMAQLCMWQLAVGYNLRELEVREELKNNLSTILGDDDDDGVDLSQPGSME